MKQRMTTWFATTTFAGLTIALSNIGTVAAQPPGSGQEGPGFGGPPHLAELFSRMDKNKDGKLSKDEVPEPMWNHLSHADKNGDGVTKDEAMQALAGRRPDGPRPDSPRPDDRRPDDRRPDDRRPDDRRPDGPRPDGPRPDDRRPDGPPDSRSRDDHARGQGPRPPMDRSRDDGPRGEERGPRDEHTQRQPDRDRNDNARRGPAPSGPDAFFDRLDKNGDGSLSRDEFHAVAKLHGDHGPDMRGDGPPRGHVGPPWANQDRGNFHGPQHFQGGPPWSRFGQGPQGQGKFNGPPWAQHAPRDRDSHTGKKHKGQDKKKKDGDHHKKSRQHDRSDSQQPDHHRHSDTKSPRTSADLVTAGTTQTESLPL